MARLNLEHAVGAHAGELGAAPQYARELAERLRSAPTAAECAEAARILERLADGLSLSAAAMTGARGRAPNCRRSIEVGRAVDALIKQGKSVGEARARVAKRECLSVSRVKALHLVYRRADAAVSATD